MAKGKIKNRERKEFLYITENGCLRKFLICTVSDHSGQNELLRQKVSENVLLSQD